jgi:hypothetical protein
MQAGWAVGTGPDGVFGARLMGRSDQCLQLKLTESVPRTVNLPEAWCVLPYPHEGDCNYSGGPGAC